MTDSSATSVSSAVDHPGAPLRGTDIAVPAADLLLHGAVLYPPGGTHAAMQLQSLDSASASQVPGVIACIRRGSFAGVVAVQRTLALQACALLDAHWATPVASAASLQDATVDAPGGKGQPRGEATNYAWQPGRSADGSAWAIAWRRNGQLSVWVDTHRPAALREEIAALTGLKEQGIRIVDHGGATPDGYETAIEAVLLAWDMDRPVRVQSARADALRISARSDDPRSPATSLAANPRWQINAPGPNRFSQAGARCGLVHPAPGGMHVLTDYARAPVPDGQMQTTVADPHSYAAATVFAQESYFDEYCQAQGLDPVETRMAQLKSEKGRQLLRRVARKAGWEEGDAAARPGLGLAYSHIIDNDRRPPQEIWSAWAVELGVDKATGQLAVHRLTVGHDANQAQDAGVAPMPAKALQDRLGRWAQALLGDTGHGVSKDASSQGGRADLAVPDVNLVNGASSLQPAVAWGPGVELPAAAAIANAVYSATGVRLRETPFALPQVAIATERKRRGGWRKTWMGGMLAAAAGAVMVASPWRPAIAPVNGIDTSIFSEQAIARGRLVALAGDCMVCHTVEGGEPYAGGLGLETPFGTVYTTNITPDPETGIGNWSYKAFERAMRDGIHRDGSHLYPAFPYTAYAKMSDEDLQSLYAYLMTRPAVVAQNKETRLPFPMNMRPLLAGWNMLFHRDRQAYVPDTGKSPLWNRGAYLVNSSGHCAACHSPRNALGAEKNGEKSFLGGGFADNWEAPALNRLSSAPIPWTEQELFSYLRTGYSPLHGVAAGPMGPVVAGLAQLPEEDVRAIAHYLASLNPAASQRQESHAALAAQLEAGAQAEEQARLMPGETLFNGACAVCHDPRGGPVLFGARPSLALNSNLHSDHPDNAIQVLMHGITRPAVAGLGSMPGFKNSMNDEQMASLLSYMRKRFAPDQPAWKNLKEKIGQIRTQPGHP